MTRGCSRSRRRSRESGGSWDRSVHGIHVGLLKVATIWDPAGFQRRIHLDIGTARDKEAILLFTGTQRPKGRVNNAQSVTCVHKLSLGHMSIFKKFSEQNSTQTSGPCDTCRHTIRLRVRKSHDVKKKNISCHGHTHWARENIFSRQRPDDYQLGYQGNHDTVEELGSLVQQAQQKAGTKSKRGSGNCAESRIQLFANAVVKFFRDRPSTMLHSEGTLSNHGQQPRAGICAQV